MYWLPRMGTGLGFSRKRCSQFVVLFEALCKPSERGFRLVPVNSKILVTAGALGAAHHGWAARGDFSTFLMLRTQFLTTFLDDNSSFHTISHTHLHTINRLPTCTIRCGYSQIRIVSAVSALGPDAVRPTRHSAFPVPPALSDIHQIFTCMSWAG